MGMGYGGRSVKMVEVGNEWFVGWRLRFMSGMFGFSGLKIQWRLSLSFWCRNDAKKVEFSLQA